MVSHDLQIVRSDCTTGYDETTVAFHRFDCPRLRGLEPLINSLLSVYLFRHHITFYRDFYIRTGLTPDYAFQPDTKITKWAAWTRTKTSLIF